MLRVVAVCALALGCHLLVAADADIKPDNYLKNETSVEIFMTVQPEVHLEIDDEDGEQKNINDDNYLKNETSVEKLTTIPPEVNLKSVDEDGDQKEQSVCSRPPDIDGVISPVLEGEEYPVGTIVSYQCKFGYVSRSSSSLLSVCRIDKRSGKAEWMHSNITCIPRSCGDPGYVVNGRRIGNLFTFPNSVKFECLEGYKLKGLKERYCQVNGEWSGKLPTCVPIRCPVPSNPKSGRVLYSSLDYGTELEYKCDKGFTLEDHLPRICTEDEIWSNNEPECIEKRCTVPKAPEHGSVQLSDEPKAGTLAFYFCDDDTTLVGTSTSKCLNSGDWTFDPPKCLSSCYVSAVEDGDLGRYQWGSRISSRQKFVSLQIGDHVKHNETVTLRCKDGYSPGNLTDGQSKEVTCNDGTWSEPLQCHPKQCTGQPPPTDNASPVIGSRMHGQSIWYRCDPGYEKAKRGKVVCKLGKWEGNTPVCADYRCYTEQLIYPGLVKPPRRFLHHNEHFNVTCEKAYTVSSLEKQVLCFEGKWNITKNPCIIKTCEKEPPTLSNGKARKFSRVNGSFVDYACDKDYEMVGYSSVHCAFGEWHGQPPVCKITIKDPAAFPAKESENNSVSAESLNSTSDFFQPEECFCTYDYNTDYLIASWRGTEIRNDDRIKKGEKVLFTCRYLQMNIVWPNGLRLFEKVELVCDPCQDWKSHQLPECETLVPGDSYIVYDSRLKIMPGGIIEVPKSESISITCSNPWLQPKWNVIPTEKIYVQENIAPVKETGQFKADIVIKEMDYEHVGRYECFAWNYNEKMRPAVIDLKLYESGILCPALRTETDLGSFEIVYSNERKVNSVARYKCKNPLKKIVGPRERKCQSNGKWSSSFPSCQDIMCREFRTDNSLSVTYSNGTKMNSIASFICLNDATLVGSSTAYCLHNGTWSHPKPSCKKDIRCPSLNGNKDFLITYSNRRKVNSVAFYSCKSTLQRLIGSRSRTCLHSGEWSGTIPVCEDIMCREFRTYNGLSVTYSKGTKVNSVASFSCLNHATLIGSLTAHCLRNGTWSHPTPSCEMLEIHCPKIDGKGIFNIQYSNNRRINSTALFFCKALKQKVAGCNFMICQQNGEWSGEYPTCVDYVTCEQFATLPNLNVIYTDGSRVGSIASFQCSPPTSLVGSFSATCLSNGTWSNISPICSVPDCSIHNLTMSLPESIFPDMTNITSEFVTPGSDVQLMCPDDSILTGSTKALCNSHGKWEVSDVQCTPACRVIKDEKSHLIVEPVKDYHRFGDFIVLSCPPGQKLTSEVERMMCLGKTWSNTLPDCIELTEPNPSGFTQTTLKSG